MDPLALAALITAIGSTLLGTWAEISRRQANRDDDQTTRQSAAFQELTQGMAEQRNLLDLYRQENGRMQAEVIAAEAKAEASLSAHSDCELKVAALTRKLHEMDARISELGG